MKTGIELKAELVDIEEYIKTIKSQLSNAGEKRNEILIDLYKLQTGFKVGDKVQYKDGRKIVTGEITSFKVQYNSATCVVTLHKSDGTLGLRTKDYFYSHSELTVIS